MFPVLFLLSKERNRNKWTTINWISEHSEMGFGTNSGERPSDKERKSRLRGTLLPENRGVLDRISVYQHSHNLKTSITSPLEGTLGRHQFCFFLASSKTTFKFSELALRSSIGVSIIIGTLLTALFLSIAAKPALPILPRPMCSCRSVLELRSVLESFRCNALISFSPTTESKW